MTLVQRTRERSYVTFDAPEGYLRGGARVGIEDSATIGAYGTAIDGRYTLLEEELRTHYRSKWGADLFIVKGEIPVPKTEVVYTIAQFNPAKESVIPPERLADYRADRNFYTTWELDLENWRIYWADMRDSVPVPLLTAPGIKDKLDQYDQTQREWQKKADGIGVKTTTPPTPPKTDKDGNVLDSFDGFNSLLKNITWVVGLGFVFYIFTMFIAPPLLSGAARTKEGYRGLRG